jgi:PASTA domain/NPCBM/NEW2 domain
VGAGVPPDGGSGIVDVDDPSFDAPPEPLAPAEPPSSPPPPRRFRRVKRTALLTLVVLALAAGILATGGYLGYRAADRSAPDPEVVSPVTLVINEVQPRKATTADGAKVNTPDVAGLDEATARSVMTGALADVSVTVDTRPAAGDPGRVVDQTPAPGEALEGQVVLVLSAPATVPDVTGQKPNDARKVLEELGATVFLQEQYQAGAEPGTVIAVDPAVGQAMPQEMTLTVAQAPASVALGDVVPVSAACSLGKFKFNGVQYDNSLQCTSSTTGFVVGWNLNRKIDHFTAAVGVADTEVATKTARVEVLADGAPLFDQAIAFGQTVPIDVSVAGVLRLEIRISAVDPLVPSTQVVIGDGSLIGSEQAVNGLAIRP